MTYLEDFYVQVEDVEEFATTLEELCMEYAQEGDEENFYFDYEETEGDNEEIYFEATNFEILTEDYDGFLEALDELCAEYAIDEDYDYTVTE